MTPKYGNPTKVLFSFDRRSVDVTTQSACFYLTMLLGLTFHFHLFVNLRFSFVCAFSFIDCMVFPTGYWNGWATFIASIVFIGFMTAIIGDLAEGLGCTVGLKATVTAISFVAVGTSLPGLRSIAVTTIDDLGSGILKSSILDFDIYQLF